MRTTKPLTFESILQIAGKGGCVICAFLKNHQSAWLEHPGMEGGRGLCNYHGWALAAAADGRAAAEIFVRMLDDCLQGEGKVACEICKQMMEEEQTKLTELNHALREAAVMEWLAGNKALCLRHARKLAGMAESKRAAAFMEIVEGARDRVRGSLQAFITESAHGGHAGGGALGRAAELLFGSRGLPRAGTK
jgi:hypothetical protein